MNPSDSIPSNEQSAQRQPTIQKLPGADLASLTLGELLGATLFSVCLGERQAYLEQSLSDAPNDFTSARSTSAIWRSLSVFPAPATLTFTRRCCPSVTAAAIPRRAST